MEEEDEGVALLIMHGEVMRCGSEQMERWLEAVDASGR